MDINENNSVGNTDNKYKVGRASAEHDVAAAEVNSSRQE